MKLVTCGLPYANGKAHIGHLRTYVPADVYVKYMRMFGEEVIFVCGSDCHGTPIVVNAEKEGLKPRELVDIYHEHFNRVFKEIDIEFDYFGRTDEEYHHRRTQEIVKRLIDNGYIYPREIELAYCPNCDRFLPDRYVEGICPYCGATARGDECDQGCGRHLEPGEILEPRCKICGSRAVFRKQKHYFFKLTEFKDFLLDFLSNLRGTENALNYARQWVSMELKDWCITRNLEWGVKFPGEDLVVYVWVDAPIGYISFTERACESKNIDWKKIWVHGDAEIIHFIGLDIVYHHCIFWPAMLRGAKYALPSSVIASGMVKVDGKTFSKTRGYVVWLEEDYLKSGLNTDFLRYYLVNYTSHQKDLNFSWEVFGEKINNELIANLGNFLYRVTYFAWKNFREGEKAEIDAEVDEKALSAIKTAMDKIKNGLANWEFKVVSDAFMELSSFGNNYFQNAQPWDLVKKDVEEAKRVVASCLQIARAIVLLSYPVLPKTMKEFSKVFGMEIEKEKIDSAMAVSKFVISKPKIPFQKIPDEKIEELQHIMLERIKKAEEANKISVNEDKEEQKKEQEKQEEQKEQKDQKAREISYEEFQRLDLRIGKIVKAEKIKKSRKLMRLEIDIGDEIRQVVAGIAEEYSPEDVEGKLVPVLVNLKPAKLMGVESRGMILAADINGKPVLLHPDREVEPGSKIR
ncbi:methionyl-tRNA synthetase [Archaeoglobus sulfaticallidus PM70-1]|uniref:Methionine--tRNA ligase n=1 Tax=Archaeoglobus sulfaticallidus PM70-1 TaxID=387631 RepID=N0BFE6_9EURY|nr:methionine--tRNA ligase [Archaeoglobus sulfaticallidus]AGK60977.1 methionyl-tRNA synthetase [Archaeoglobus sulfaticallidus PM70-1]